MFGYILTETKEKRIEGDRLYTAAITTGSKDPAGNALASEYVWNFKAFAVPESMKLYLRTNTQKQLSPT